MVAEIRKTTEKKRKKETSKTITSFLFYNHLYLLSIVKS